jgi:putative oxidoreductase
MSGPQELVSHPAAVRQAELGALLLRIALGAVLIAHAALKVFGFTLAGSVQFFESIGLAGWLVYPVVAFEIVAGVLLIAGLFVRTLALASAALLAVTIYVHAGNGWLFANPNGGWEYPLFLTFVALALALIGEGAYALRWPKARRVTAAAGASSA